MNRREMFKIAATATLLSAGAVNAADMKSTERPMRRTDRILTLEEAREVIRHTPHAVLATAQLRTEENGKTCVRTRKSRSLLSAEARLHQTSCRESFQ